jgi:hypothetical protein
MYTYFCSFQFISNAPRTLSAKDICKFPKTTTFSLSTTTFPFCTKMTSTAWSKWNGFPQISISLSEKLELRCFSRKENQFILFHFYSFHNPFIDLENIQSRHFGKNQGKLNWSRQLSYQAKSSGSADISMVYSIRK